MTVLNAELRPHPTTPCDAIRRFGVTIDPARLPQELEVRFRIEGEMHRLRLPPPGFARRSDGLWQHTCFEAFLRHHAGDGYYEFNFAPSGDWAAYRFVDRRRDRTSPEMPYPPFALERSRDYCELIAFIPMAALPEFTGTDSIRVGLATVVEMEDESISYWALAHRTTTPDFHDPSTFALTVMTP